MLLGLRYYPDTDNYCWSDDTDLDYKNYANGFEQYRDFYGYCTKLVNGQWTNAECDVDQLKFICYREAYNVEMTLDNVCPDVSTSYMIGGVITSPGYPLNFNLNTPCYYHLVAKNGYFITIRIENIDTDGSIKVYKTWEELSDKNLIATIDNHFIGLDISVQHNHVVLYLDSSKGKFEISWTSKPSNNTLTLNECPDERNVYTNFETIISPGYPNVFTLPSEVSGYGCSYKVIAPGRYFIKLHFDDISFENNKGYIDVYYRWDSNKNFINRYNNNNKGNDVTINGRLDKYL